MDNNGSRLAPQLTWSNIVSTMALLITLAGGFWLVFQNQLSDQKEQVSRLRVELSQASHEAYSKTEQVEFSKRLDHELLTVRDQLKILEQTRPTTGELAQAILGASTARAQLDERVKSLEDHVRAPRQLVPIAPPTH